VEKGRRLEEKRKEKPESRTRRSKGKEGGGRAFKKTALITVRLPWSDTIAMRRKKREPDEATWPWGKGKKKVCSRVLAEDT